VLFRIVFFYGPIWYVSSSRLLTHDSNPAFPLSRFIIFVTMMLYVLVGIEILKQRHMFKSLDSDYVTLDTITVPAKDVHFHAVTIDIKVQSSPEPVAVIAERKETGGSSISNSTSHLHPTDSIALPHRAASRSPVSFKKYILMPLMFFVVLLAIWVAPTTNRISAFINPNYMSYPLLLAVGSTGSLRGFWNGVVFITIGMRARMRQKKIERTYG
jgi:prepilin signal peptidase PulO-like enzyme (type II secretory pathway)